MMTIVPVVILWMISSGWSLHLRKMISTSNIMIDEILRNQVAVRQMNKSILTAQIPFLQMLTGDSMDRKVMAPATTTIIMLPPPPKRYTIAIST
jgi:hypothetical protein